MQENVTALGLMSGGLDSQIAAKVLMEQGITVVAVCFITPFFGAHRAQQAAKALDIKLVEVDFTEAHLEMLFDPPHGYGKNMNPCIDCHALMFQFCGNMLSKYKADFIFSGEVLGQRPMSQNKQSLNTVAKTSGYRDKILRPLSAQLLSPTQMEIDGLVDRNKLLDIEGRSRKRQIALAKQYQLEDYPNPGGGCLLTDPNFSKRLKDLIANGPDTSKHDITLLTLGRHIRLPSGVKIIVGRDEKENDKLETLVQPGEALIQVDDIPGPTCLVTENATEQEYQLAAQIAVYYSRADNTGLYPIITRINHQEHQSQACAVDEIQLKQLLLTFS